MSRRWPMRALATLGPDMGGSDGPGRFAAAPDGTYPQVGEHAAVARLAPESPLLFARARRALRELAGSDGRLLAGRTAPGCWSVLPAEGEWLSVRRAEDGTTAPAVAFPAARSAVADAAAGVLAAAGVRLTSGLLELAEIIVRDPFDGRPFWKAGAAGERIKERGGGPAGPRADGPGVAIDALEGRRLGYFACAPGAPPERGAYAGLHEIYELAVRNLLPPDPEEGAAGVELPEGTELDGYGDTGQVFLFAPGTPFIRRGLWGGPDRHEHRVYRVLRPLRAYEGFPVSAAILPASGGGAGRAASEGQGYLLVDTVADLVGAGVLAEVAGGAAGRGGG